MDARDEDKESQHGPLFKAGVGLEGLDDKDIAIFGSASDMFTSISAAIYLGSRAGHRLRQDGMFLSYIRRMDREEGIIMGMHGLFFTELEFQHGIMDCLRALDNEEERMEALGAGGDERMKMALVGVLLDSVMQTAYSGFQDTLSKLSM